MKIVKVAATSLIAPFGATATSFTLAAFVDSQGNAVSLASWGVEAFFVVVLKQATTTEMVKCSAVTINADGTATFTVATNGRNISPVTPYAGVSTGQDFSAGADAICTNDPLTMSRFATISEDQTFAGKNTFTQVPSTSAAPVLGTDIPNLTYVQGLVLGTLTTINVIIPGTAGATVAAGSLVYLDTATGTWKLADGTNAATVNNTMLGIAQGAGVAAGAITGGVLVQGVDTHQSGLTTGNIQYASNTPGAISATPGTIVVVVGVAKSATSVYFNPRFDQQLTNDQINALAGVSGTALSSSNKVEDQGDTSVTSAANKLARMDGTGRLNAGVIPLSVYRFGGTGADGALTVSSGTTNIDLGGALIFEKDYSSISITGTGKVVFINPNSRGTFIAIRCQGNATLTSSQTPMLDASGCGGDSSTAGIALDGTSVAAGGNAGDQFGGTFAGAGGGTGNGIDPNLITGKLVFRGYVLATGGGGGAATLNGGIGSGTTPGGRGGGALYLEVGGALNFTTTNGISVAGVNAVAGGGGFYGGPGGGAGGTFLCMYNTLTANTGTVIITGGNGVAGNGGSVAGTGGNGTSGSGNGGSGGSSTGGGSGHTNPGSGGGSSYFNTTNGNNATNSSSNEGAGGGGASGVSKFIQNTYFA